MIDVSESFDEIGHVVYNDFDKGLIGNHIIHIYDFKNVNSKWLFYYILKNQLSFRSISYGDKVASLKISDISQININLPPLYEQKKIIEIIKPLEDMIDNLNNIKETTLKFIDSLPVKNTGKYIKFKSIQTGRHNANFETPNGKYPFYTCGIKIRKCSSYSFDGRYIILSGNASLYTWWIDGKFDLYQRVYALLPHNNFFTSYHSVRNAMRKLRDESSGSVIKYITLGDIEKIELLDNSYEEKLSKLYKIVSSAERILDDIDNIKNMLIKLLIK